MRPFTGHEDWVNDAVFSLDGDFVFTASADKTARLFDVATGVELRRLAGHEDGLVSAVFAPDGRFVLTASWDKTARLFDAATGAELRQFSSHEEGVNGAVFSPDGRFVLTASDDKALRLFDAANGQCISILYSFPDAVAICDGQGEILSLRGKAWKYVYALEEREGQLPRIVNPGPLPMDVDVSLFGGGGCASP